MQVFVHTQTRKHTHTHTPTDTVFPKTLPSPCTVRRLVQEFWDIRAQPRRYFFELLSFFAKEDREQERLREFAMPENLVRESLFLPFSPTPPCRNILPRVRPCLPLPLSLSLML